MNDKTVKVSGGVSFSDLPLVVSTLWRVTRPDVPLDDHLVFVSAHAQGTLRGNEAIAASSSHVVRTFTTRGGDQLLGIDAARLGEQISFNIDTGWSFVCIERWSRSDFQVTLIYREDHPAIDAMLLAFRKAVGIRIRGGDNRELYEVGYKGAPKPDALVTRTVVTVTLDRTQIPRLSKTLHVLCGADVSGMQDRFVYLPSGTETFGLLHGVPGGLVFSRLTPSERYVARHCGVLVGVSVDHLSVYFGWSGSGYRIEFLTVTGEDYSATLTYDVSGGTEQHWQLAMLTTLLDYGRNPGTVSLTAAAELEFRYRGLLPDDNSGEKP